ncbi:MAG TPA: enolase C-terminal domain-like protein [Chloroflexota bacterium]|jgi:L-alanine-DL-glutamate epimerase-like enolase superfamily enzyme|nr:enolase C-terminal domain-like protein [Chloroflexota bacterium]
MKIAQLKAVVVELPDSTAPRARIVTVPGTERYTHQWLPGAGPEHELYLRVVTDEGVEGVCTANVTPSHASHPRLTPQLLDVLREQVIGDDPLRREELYQKLHRGTRWVYQTPGWFGAFDNCLWDIAGKVAGLPVCRLLGQVRDRIPAYHTGGDGDGEPATYLKLFEEVRARWGITAYKFHNYRGARQNVGLFRELRRQIGDDFGLINDPVCSYSLREAIEVGRVMEELGFVWLEEPFREQELRAYQELCAALTIPVMATEMLMHDVDLCAQWLIAGATDLIRVNARNGTTAAMKLAHFAELHGTTVELNAGGGLGNHLHVQLQCAIANTQYFEHFAHHAERTMEAGIANPVEVVDGHLSPSMSPGWGAEIDWDYVRTRTVQEY